MTNTPHFMILLIIIYTHTCSCNANQHGNGYVKFKNGDLFLTTTARKCVTLETWSLYILFHFFLST